MKRISEKREEVVVQRKKREEGGGERVHYNSIQNCPSNSPSFHSLQGG